MPSRAVTSFLPNIKETTIVLRFSNVSMPSRAVTSFLLLSFVLLPLLPCLRVNALSGCYLISTGRKEIYGRKICIGVNALSGCYLISTPTQQPQYNSAEEVCQCPLGLLPHFYLSDGKDYLLRIMLCVNALSGCYLISTVPLQKTRFYAASRACFCRYLSEYSDNSCFSCMLTIWTYFMRYTYP